MEIHEELLCQDIGRYILSHLQVLPFQAADVESKAISLLRDIQAVIQDMERSDFEMVEDIITLFEEYGLDAGVRHDFRGSYFFLFRGFEPLAEHLIGGHHD